MNTREYTKILKSNLKISSFEVKTSSIVGVVTITRFRPSEEKVISNHYNREDDQFTISRTESIGNDIDITFKGEIRSSMERWYDVKKYKKNSISRWLRLDKTFKYHVINRVYLIGGDSNTVIKKITLI
jgi:hypothetical protein|tara:strand:- start:21 stop:404 length:384 start_codon:yes stop_codon:yes gene_type:complete